MDQRKIAILMAVFTTMSACHAAPRSQVIDYQAEGNLESPRPAGCVQVNELSNEQNPVDIFAGLDRCLAQERYSNAAELYLAGMAYGYFDTRRVSDKSAHQAISVLRMNLFASQPGKALDKMQAALGKLYSDNRATCENLSMLGAPAYKPTYMIQHGIAAFTGHSTKDGLVENFDPESAWKEALSTIARCIQG